MGYLPLINWCTISIVVISPSSPAIAPGLISFGRTVSKPPKPDDLHESRAAYFGMFHGFHGGGNDQVQMFYRFLSNQKSDGQHQLLLLSSSFATTLYFAPCLSSFIIRHGQILDWYVLGSRLPHHLWFAACFNHVHMFVGKNPVWRSSQWIWPTVFF